MPTAAQTVLYPDWQENLKDGHHRYGNAAKRAVPTTSFPGADINRLDGRAEVRQHDAVRSAFQGRKKKIPLSTFLVEVGRKKKKSSKRTSERDEARAVSQQHK